ncbi:excisionase family DNA-binding protein [Candidatus Poribacteria bacterium]|nr:excisionase family DNA-binding protein [Candidatus Poribacteria bacterium]
MLSVTPDTVVKWIRRGKLKAMKTAGGHYRIPHDSVASLLPAARDIADNEHMPSKRPPVPCWEYNAAAGKIKENCRSCLVFKAKGSRCYDVGRVLREKGEGATCCQTDCEECSYYREQRQRPINVLVFTDNALLRGILTKQASSTRFRFQFASCEYDCSLVVDSFRPEYVIVDCVTDLEKCEELCRHLACDPRIPGVEIILAVPRDKNIETNLVGGITVIEQPFCIADIEKRVEYFEQIRKT